jgi:hypothetical protein
MSDSISQTGLIVILIDGEHRMDSRLIAEKLGLEHESFIKTTRTYHAELQELGVVPHFTENPFGGKSGRPQKYAMLNMDQVLFSVLLESPKVETLMFFLDITGYHNASSQTTFFADFMNSYSCDKESSAQKETRVKAEKRIELELAKSLARKGIHVQRQVQCSVGAADVVTPDSIYEVKAFLSPTRIREAITQVLGYRTCINPNAKVYVVGKRWKEREPETKFAKALGVEIIVWGENEV